MIIRGKVRMDRRTKKLAKRLQPNEIAIIDHKDLDEVAAHTLVKAKVKAVLNIQPSISGKYPNQGPLVLADAGIPVLDNVFPDLFHLVQDGDEIIIDQDTVYFGQQPIAKGQLLDKHSILQKMEHSKINYQRELESFISNTLEYASRELSLFLKEWDMPPLPVDIKDRHCLIVVRGQNYQEDLEAIAPYIAEMKPVLIGVDGGADALLENGYHPHIIIGDMDSVTDKALHCGAHIIVHAYQNGTAPGLQRIKHLGLNAQVLPAPGTSEDVAMLLAYENGAGLIVVVGAHSNVIDFLEKGRKGMASTFLVRMKVGSILVDAKGVNKLYRQKVKMRYLAQIVVAALIPFAIVFVISPATYQLVRLLMMRLRLLFYF